MNCELSSVDLSTRDFERIGDIVHKIAGIRLVAGKEGLVKSRLTKRLRTLGMTDFGQYLDYVQHDRASGELGKMIDELTTNKTSFFRESQHFDYLRSVILPDLKPGREIRIWSAGCSTGEEPYSIAMTVREEWYDMERSHVRILATDVSHRVLARAQEGVYTEEQLADVDPVILRRHFGKRPGAGNSYEVRKEVRQAICFAHLNLMHPWPMKGPFHVIFCRNVMIYFDKPTQQTLVARFWELLESGGHLFIGHSESLSGSCHRFRYVQPATYVK